MKSASVTLAYSGGAVGSVTVSLNGLADNPPVGMLESALSSQQTATVSQYDNLTVSGWAADPEDGAPVSKVTVAVTQVAASPYSVLVADTADNRLRKIDVNGIITTIAGDGNSTCTAGANPLTSEFDQIAAVAVSPLGNIYFSSPRCGYLGRIDANGALAKFPASGVSYPYQLGFDKAGNLYVADGAFFQNQTVGEFKIKKVDAAGTVTTVAGNGVNATAGDGGAATSASLHLPYGLAVDGSGNIYIGEPDRVRKVTASTGIISTVAGGGSAAAPAFGDGGPATSAVLRNLGLIAVDASGNLYLADTGHNRVRKVDLYGVITNFAGTGVAGSTGDGDLATNARILPQGVSVDAAGNVLIADFGAAANGTQSRIRQVAVDTGIITTVAGGGSALGDNGPAIGAQLSSATYAVAQGTPPPTVRVPNSTLGIPRPDVVTSTGRQDYLNSGWTATVNLGALPPGNYAVSAVAYDSQGFTTALPGTKNITVVAGSSAVASLSRTSVAFANQLATTTSPTQEVAIINAGNLPLRIASLTVSGDFIQSNSCGAPVAPGSGCSVFLRFRPSVAATRAGSLTIFDNGPGSPHMVSLSGTGTDFTIVLSRPARPARGAASNLIVTGQAARYDFELAGSPGFGGVVGLSCSGAPRFSSCSVKPARVKLSGDTVPIQVMVQTAAGTRPSQRLRLGLRASSRPGTPAGRYRLTLFAQSQGAVRAETFDLTIVTRAGRLR